MEDVSGSQRADHLDGDARRVRPYPRLCDERAPPTVGRHDPQGALVECRRQEGLGLELPVHGAQRLDRRGVEVDAAGLNPSTW